MQRAVLRVTPLAGQGIAPLVPPLIGALDIFSTMRTENMNIIDKMFNFGSSFRVLLFTAATVCLAISFMTRQEGKTVTFAMIFMGLYGIRREFRQWRINRLPEIEQLSSKMSSREG